MTLPRKVDYFANREDMQAALLGSMGFSTAYIQSKTRLTQCQVTYRLAKAKIKRSNYRDGISPVAQTIFQTVGHNVELIIASQLRKAMGLNVVSKNGKKRRVG